MLEHCRKIIVAQFEASLCMLNECMAKCPDEHWDGKIAKYPFWQVAYHTLCFVDAYLSRNEAAFVVGKIHPLGLKELSEEYPSRRFERDELMTYLGVCREKAASALAAETSQTLEGESGFSRVKFSRTELHLYNIRHIQHHAGQLSAFLRRVGVDTRWVGSGWK